MTNIKELSNKCLILFLSALIAKTAHKNGTTLKQEVIRAGLIEEKEYDKIMNPLKMTKPK